MWVTNMVPGRPGGGERVTVPRTAGRTKDSSDPAPLYLLSVIRSTDTY